MSFGSSHDAKEQIRQSIDIVDLIGSYFPLRRQGRAYVGICPWHSDARPSLQVNQERQSWKCWVCDIGGDIFSFTMQREQVDFREALELLADRAGVQLSRGPQTKPGDPNDKKTLFDAVRWASNQFSDCLAKSPEAQVARQYCDERNIETRSRTKFQLGFAPNHWQWLLDRARSSPFSPAVLEAAGLLGKSAQTNRYYDRFKGRVTFPIRDSQQRAIAFGGRILPEFSQGSVAKYINTPETRLFSKSEHVYGLDLAREAISKSRHVVVVEGYTDVIMAHQHGLENFVAVLGTALGSRHIQLLRRYADSITLVLDGDEAGQRRTNEVLELFVASETDLRILTLPDGYDPCDYVAQQGADAMRSALESAADVFTHAVHSQTAGIDLLQDTHRANQALEQLLGVIAKAPRLSRDTNSARVLRERQILSRLAREFQIDESTLRQRITELREAESSSHRVQGSHGIRGASPDGSSTGLKLDPIFVELLGILVIHPELAEVAIGKIDFASCPDERVRVILATYRQLVQEGENPEFTRVMTAIDESTVKSLLVGIDEQATAKEAMAQEDAAARLCRVGEELQNRTDQAQRRQTIAALEEQRCSEEEEIGILNDLVERERKRQGIPAPTDG